MEKNRREKAFLPAEIVSADLSTDRSAVVPRDQ